MAKPSVLDQIVAFLDKKKIPYEVMKHKEVYLSKDLAKACKVKEKEVAKVLLLKTEKKKYLAAVLPSDLMAKLKKLKAHVGAKELTMVTEKEMKSKTGCPPGAMPALTGLFGITPYVDPTLAKNKHIVIRGGTYTESVKVPGEIMTIISGVKSASFSVKPSDYKKKKKKK